MVVSVFFHVEKRVLCVVSLLFFLKRGCVFLFGEDACECVCVARVIEEGMNGGPVLSAV